MSDFLYQVQCWAIYLAFAFIFGAVVYGFYKLLTAVVRSLKRSKYELYR